MAVVIIVILLVIAGIAYYFYDRNETMEYGQDQLGASSLNGDGTALSRDDIQKESFDDSLNGLEADLDSESANDYYDENTYVTDSNSSGDLVLTY